MAYDDNPSWRLVERLVALLEKALEPNASIRHDLRLPDLATGRMRQFDVVVDAGPSQRRIRTVVEVQNRKRKVGLQTLQGWWSKAQSVGAHQLICVSAAGFTSGCIEEVRARIGPRVRLIVLEELEQSDWPINFVTGHVEVTVVKPTLQQGKTAILDVPDVSPVQDLANVRFDAPLFYRDGVPEAVSLARLVHEAVELTPDLARAAPGTYARNLQIPTTPGLWVGHEGRFLQVRGLVVPALAHVLREHLRLQMASYTQLGDTAALAWSAHAVGVVDGEEVSIRVVFKPNDDGTFQLSEFETTGVPEQAQLSVLHVEE